MMSVLWELCESGSLPEVRAALARGEDVNSKDGEDGETGLMIAVENGHNSIVKLLLEQPTLDLNCSNILGYTAWQKAVYNDNVEAVRMLLADPRLNTVNQENGETGLMHAVENEYNLIVKLLLEHPPLDLNYSDCIGYTAMHNAAYFNNVEAARMLLADPRLNTVNQKNLENKTPVMLALDEENVNVLRELVAHPSVDLSEELVARMEFDEGRCIVVEEQLRRARRQAEGLMQQLADGQMNRGKSMLDVEELKRKQEELVKAAIKENEESELDVLRKNEERLNRLKKQEEEMRKEREEIEQKEMTEAQEKEEKLVLENKERAEAMKKTNQEEKVKLEMANRQKEEKLKRKNRETEDKLNEENLKAEELLEKKNKAREEIFEKESKAKEEKLKKENREALALKNSRKKIKDEAVMEVFSRSEQHTREENEEIVENMKRKNKERVALLLNRNKTELAKQEEEEKRMGKQQEEEQRMAKKRKADQLAAPQCPVCFDKMVPPTRIFQCDNGHHICETCKSRLIRPLCPKCRKNIMGRATDMENFLKDTRLE